MQKAKPPADDSGLFKDKPLLSDAELKIFEDKTDTIWKTMRKIPGILRFGKLQGNEKDIQTWVRYRVYRLTLKKYRDDVKIHKERLTLMNVVGKCAFLANDAAQELAIRQLLCAEVVKRCEDLLDNHIAVRLQAVAIISQLNILASKPRINRRNVVAYAPAALSLVKILEDPNQHIGVKIIAAQGMTRISRAGSINYGMTVNISRRIGNALIYELEKKNTHYKYQVRLAESLGALRIASDQRNQPIYVDRLCRTMIDEERHPEVRSAAAEALGVAQFASVITNPQQRHLIVHEILKTTHEIAVNYNAIFITATKAEAKAKAQEAAKAAFQASLRKGLDKANWKFCFLRLYFSFEGSPFLRKHLGNIGLSSRFSNDPKIIGALAAIKPVVKHMVEKGGFFKKRAPEPVPKPFMDALAKWINDNPPVTDRLSPGLNPLRSVTASAEDPKDQK